MRRILPIAFFWLAFAPLCAANAQVECVKAQCEGKGRTCIETLRVTYDTCVKTARKNCDAVPAAEKFNCLRSNLAPCAQTRNKEQNACLAGVQACYKTCGPVTDKRAHYWCVADTRSGATAAFCAASAGTTSPLEQCAQAFGKTAELTGGMTCESLN